MSKALFSTTLLIKTMISIIFIHSILAQSNQEPIQCPTGYTLSKLENLVRSGVDFSNPSTFLSNKSPFTYITNQIGLNGGEDTFLGFSFEFNRISTGNAGNSSIVEISTGLSNEYKQQLNIDSNIVNSLHTVSVFSYDDISIKSSECLTATSQCTASSNFDSNKSPSPIQQSQKFTVNFGIMSMYGLYYSNVNGANTKVDYAPNLISNKVFPFITIKQTTHSSVNYMTVSLKEAIICRRFNSDIDDSVSLNVIKSQCNPTSFNNKEKDFASVFFTCDLIDSKGFKVTIDDIDDLLLNKLIDVDFVNTVTGEYIKLASHEISYNLSENGNINFVLRIKNARIKFFEVEYDSIGNRIIFVIEVKFFDK